MKKYQICSFGLNEQKFFNYVIFININSNYTNKNGNRTGW